MNNIDIEKLYMVTREEFGENVDAVLDKVKETSPILIRSEGEPDLLLFDYEHYMELFGFLYTEEQIAEIEAGLSGIEKEIPTALFEKYNKKKQDKIFPVFVPEMNNSCGGCMMELPSAQIEKLAKEGFLECENCRRIIFKPQQNQ